MDGVESLALEQLMTSLPRSFEKDHRFTEFDVCKIHRQWLGKIYGWAGRYHRVNLSKEGFPFASSDQIPRLMKEFGENILGKNSPCSFKTIDRVIRALAETHVEFVLIHPFREGNGRIARVLTTLMAMQADLPMINFNALQGKKKEEYFAAVRAGLDKNYKPMGKILKQIIAEAMDSNRISREGKSI